MKREGRVTVNTQNGISEISFYHPKGNSLPFYLLAGLKEKITEVSADNNTGVIILKSEGEKTFCGGASFAELAALDNPENAKNFFLGFAGVIAAMINSDKLVISRVQGKAVGGGVGLAAAADYTFAHESASVRLSELALGIGPFVIEPVVTRRTGMAAFAGMTIDTGWREAHEAQRAGLYNRIFDSIGEMDSEIYSLAKKLADYSPDAKHEIKKMLWPDRVKIIALMEKRAKTSGTLALSKYTRNFIDEFNKRKKG